MSDLTHSSLTTVYSWAGPLHLYFTGKITRPRAEVSAHSGTLWWRNFLILLFIVSSMFDLGQLRVPSLTSAGSYLQHLHRDNTMNGFSLPTKTLKAVRTYCGLVRIIPFILSSFFLRLSLALSAAPWQHRRWMPTKKILMTGKWRWRWRRGLNLQRRTRADLLSLSVVCVCVCVCVCVRVCVCVGRTQRAWGFTVCSLLPRRGAHSCIPPCVFSAHPSLCVRCAHPVRHTLLIRRWLL